MDSELTTGIDDQLDVETCPSSSRTAPLVFLIPLVLSKLIGCLPLLTGAPRNVNTQLFWEEECGSPHDEGPIFFWHYTPVASSEYVMRPTGS